MAITIIIEDGSGSDPDANSYATEVEFTDYFNCLGIDITGLSGDQIRQGLISAATSIMEYCYKYKGTLTHSTNPIQPLLWPRTGLCDRRGLLIDGSTIPLDVKNAQMELARQVAIELANSSDYRYSDNPTNQGVVKREKLDVLEQEFFGPGTEVLNKATRTAGQFVIKILEPYITNSNAFQLTNEAVV